VTKSVINSTLRKNVTVWPTSKTNVTVIYLRRISRLYTGRKIKNDLVGEMSQRPIGVKCRNDLL